MIIDDIDKKIIQCMNDVGIIIDEADLMRSDVNLTDYNIDSILFISLLVNIEELFGIIIPDEYMTYEILQSYCGFSTIIKEIVSFSNESDNTLNESKL